MQIRARTALAGAAACGAVLGLVWLASFHVSPLERADDRVFLAFYDLTSVSYRPRIEDIASFFVSLCDPSRFVLLGVIPAVVALVRRRVRDACAAMALVVGASVTTQALKHVLPEPHVVSLLGVHSPVPYPHFPSGHSTAAMALVLALVLVSPARVRPLVAGLGAVFAAGVGCSLLALGTHMPSDVFGGFLVAAAWSLLVVAALPAVGRRPLDVSRPASAASIRDALAPPGAALVAAVVLSAVVVLSSPHAVVSYARAHDAFVVGALVIGALSTTLATGVVLSVRRLRT